MTTFDDLEWTTVPDHWNGQRIQALPRDPDWHLHMDPPEED